MGLNLPEIRKTSQRLTSCLRNLANFKQTVHILMANKQVLRPLEIRTWLEDLVHTASASQVALHKRGQNCIGEHKLEDYHPL